ncbi:MAG: hypothetical protein QM489_07095 [Candidatus Izemoplasma sp.]
MSVDTIITWITDNLYIAIAIGVVSLFILVRMWHSVRLHLGNKKYVKKSVKLRKKKFNGVRLVDKIKKKRKKNTNTFKKLSYRGKKLTKKYLNYKSEELPIVTKYSYGKLLKRSRDKLQIIVRNERKVVMKLKLKRSYKELVKLSNKYECLDELLLFLHELPLHIIEQQDYEVYVNIHEISISYTIK